MTVEVLLVGIGCRVPRASTPAELRLALSAPHPFPPLPAERARGIAQLVDPKLARGACLEDFSVDGRLLKLPPITIDRMHRMERAALGAAVAALADAGIRPGSEVRDRTQVFLAGGCLGPDPVNDPARRIRAAELSEPILAALESVAPEEAPALAEIVDDVVFGHTTPISDDSMTTTASLVAARLANTFDFTGGHLAVDAGMSSSMAALERAFVAVRDGDCEVAIVCALSELLSAPVVTAFSLAGLLSPDPPEPFAEPRGTVLGEGSLCVVLAKEPMLGRRPYARIGGVGRAFCATGEPASLEAAVREAAAKARRSARIEPAAVPLVVTRAAGFADDRAELQGLRAAFGQDELVVKSVTPALGFLQGAAGLAALVAAALSLREQRWLFGEGRPDRLSSVGVSDAGLSDVAYHALLSSVDEREERRERAASPARRREEPLAIVGVGAFVPEARRVSAYWLNVTRRVVAIGDLPKSRFDVDLLLSGAEDVAEKLRSRLAGTIDVSAIDVSRFGIEPAAAAARDPADLIALEVSAEALESARFFVKGSLKERGGVVLGQLPVRLYEYESNKRLLFEEHLEALASRMLERGLASERIDAVLTGARRAFAQKSLPLSPQMLTWRTGQSAAALVARTFGLEHLALSIDAACASSLAALRVAAEALSQRELDVVVAGGVAYNLVPEYYLSIGILGALSPDGAPAFISGSQGFVPAEGGSAVVLRRLDDATARGDTIYAVLSGIGYSSDGSGASIFAPNPRGPRAAVERALARAGVSADEIDLIEAHGSGTELSDSAELEVYRDVYAERDVGTPVTLGTVKSQIGHLSAAAGAAGLVKAALAMHERVLPPSDVRDLAPDLPGGKRPIEIAVEPRPWAARREHPRRAAVSAFGLGGVNYHAILEEPPDGGERASTHPARLPSRGAFADRFVPELVPLALAAGPPRFSLAHKRALILDEGSDAAPVLARALKERGASAAILSLESRDPDEVAREVAEGFERAGEVNVVVDVRALRARASPSTGPAFEARLRAHNRGTLAALKSVYDRFSSAGPRGAAYLALTGLGADLGLGGAGDVDILGAALLGWVKGLKQELPDVVAKCIDFDPNEDAEVVASAALAELEQADERMEVAYMGRRLVVNLQRASFRPTDPVLHPFSSDDVFLFSGGGRGVCFECAAALARVGVRVVVTGRTPAPSPNEPWLALDDDAFAAFLREELLRRRERQPKATPVQLQNELSHLKAARELYRNLERARRQGLPLEYEVCDVGDRDAVLRLATSVIERHGRLDGIVHGAMVEKSASVLSKTPAVVDATFRTKVIGFLNLLEAARAHGTRVFCSFGSGAGRFGNRGQTDYSGANALLAALTARAGAGAEEEVPRAFTIHWTAWQGVGAAVADPSVAELVKATGVTSIPIDEGTYWFLSELALGRDAESVIFGERMLYDWPCLGSQPERALPRGLSFDDRGQPLVPGEWPFVDEILEWSERRVLAERVLDPSRDFFLSQHLLHGVPIVPATFGCEMLAEAAILAAPGLTLVECNEIEIVTPLKLHQGRRLPVRLLAEIVKEGPDYALVIVESRSDLTLSGRVLQKDRPHYRGRFLLQKSPAPPPSVPPIVEHPRIVKTRSFFHLAKDPVALGPLFCRAEGIQVVDDEVIGMIRAPRQRDVLATTSYPQLRVDPLVLDTAFQIAANWDGLRNGFVSIPFGIGSLRLGRLRDRSERALARARPVSVEEEEVRYDVEVTSEGGDLLLLVKDLCLRRISRLEKG